MGGRSGKESETSQCLPDHDSALRASITAESSTSTSPRLRQQCTGPTLAARLSAARLDSCARGNLAAAPISPSCLATYLTLLVEGRNARRLVADGSHTPSAAAVNATGSLRSTGTLTPSSCPWASWL
jgi:hypothetical protein